MASSIKELIKMLPGYGSLFSNTRAIHSRLLLIIHMLMFTWTTRSQESPPSYRQGSIIWTRCGDNIECGRLEVPLDYSNANVGQASLAIARYPATNRTGRIGTLLVNPGGPGISGVKFVYDGGKYISPLFSGRYDIVGWDPRGVSGTTPGVQCFASQTEEDIFVVNTFVEAPLDARNLSDKYDRVYFSAGLRHANARNAVYARICSEQSGETLKHVSTTTVVQDLVHLYNELEGLDSPINFWGLSYGSIIGNYFANMYPERVGRVVIDGVVNPDKWANQPAYKRPKDIFVDSEKALNNFYSACAEAGKDRCSLASIGSTAEEISRVIDGFLEKLYNSPLPVWNATRPGLLTAGMVKNMLFVSMYNPRGWKQLASNLIAALAGDGVPIVELYLKGVELNTSVAADTTAAVYAVTCSDAPPFPKDSDPLETLEHVIDEMALAQNIVSRHFGTFNFDVCYHWTAARERERFTGPFNSKLKNTMLVIGNSADPATPLRNARAVNEMMPHSTRLVVQDSTGHCSTSVSSLCTLRVLRDYFIDGKLPVNGLVCSTDEVLFPPTLANATDLDDSRSWMNTTSASRVSPEDMRLIENMHSMGKELEPFVGNFGRPRRF